MSKNKIDKYGLRNLVEDYANQIISRWEQRQAGENTPIQGWISDELKRVEAEIERRLSGRALLLNDEPLVIQIYDDE